MTDPDYTISLQAGYVLVEDPPVYEVVLSEQLPKFKAISEVCAKVKCNKVLVRGETTKVRLTTVEMMDLGKEIARLGLRIAFVLTHDASQDNERFIIDVASAYGSPIQFFAHEEEAKAWLEV